MIATLLIATVAPLAACGGGSGHRTAAPRSTVTMDTSWAESYHALSPLKAHSELAVEGTITGVQSTATTDDGIPFTDFAFTVSTILFDPGHRGSVGRTITLHQTGGTVNGRQWQAADDAAFRVGEQLVLFLREPRPGLFMVVGGPTGRFEISNGTLTPAANDGVRFAGSARAFAAAVSKA
ncbi:hypothetical protein [Streptacidiphilus pinicola]|uniref:hypothetical protein n=1 Tax=Streptacidiphilus pinicola TaxID=2219663 RepID=UPI0010575FE7|nr:hypothetical protein [Streptacidiphilus pinicola]